MAAENRPEWHQSTIHTTQYIHLDAGLIKVKVIFVLLSLKAHTYYTIPRRVEG